MSAEMVTRLPLPRLRPFVGLLWSKAESAGATRRELMLPTGRAHLAIRTEEEPLRLFRDDLDPTGCVVSSAVLCGPRSRSFIKEVSANAGSVGAWLLPGAMHLLCRSTVSSLAERHVPLEQIWGSAVRELVARIRQHHDLEQRLDVLESFLVERFPLACKLHPAVAHALEQFAHGESVTEAVHASGYSERHFRNLFKLEVGLPAKRFSRVMRFQRAVGLLSQGRSLLTAAIDSGYADQSHLTREFGSFAGLSPGHYSRLVLAHPNHIPVPDCRFVQDSPGGQA